VYGWNFLDFFPHKVGDIWVYEVISWDYTVYYQYKTEVILDSTDSSGNSYVKMRGNFPTYDRYYNYFIDTTGNVYSSTIEFTYPSLLYKTNAPFGDRWARGDPNPSEYAEVS
jgi:hypothetical protein